MSISPARSAAFEALLKIEQDQAFSSDILPLVESRLGDKDRALCHEIVLITLRNQISHDREIDIMSRGKRLDVEVRVALRMGLTQLRLLDRVPDYSAVNESVELVRRAKKASASGFVNAILRRVSKSSREFQYSDDIEQVATETSHPRWLIDKWADQFGMDETTQLSKANNTIPVTAFRTTGHPLDPAERTLIESFQVSQYVKNCWLADRVTTELIDLENRGKIYFQDEGSQFVATVVKEVAGVGKILDLCASPGSKAGILTKDFSGRLSVGDFRTPRVQLLKRNLERQGYTDNKIYQYDATKFLPFENESFGCVLADVPCSGTGTIRHNPEIRYRVNFDEIGALANKQLKMALTASKLLSQGGRIVYSTCSLETEENEEVIQRILERRPSMSVVTPKVFGSFITKDGFARTYPHRDGLDGFFVAVLEKSSS